MKKKVCTSGFSGDFEALGAELETATNDDDLPVQGPINKEPDEKLFPDERPSGIRKM